MSNYVFIFLIIIVVIVVSGEELVREALVPVYEALELDWDPYTSGSLAAELGREVDPDEVTDALVARLGRDNVVSEAELDDETLALARRLLDDHDHV